MHKSLGQKGGEKCPKIAHNQRKALVVVIGMKGEGDERDLVMERARRRRSKHSVERVLWVHCSLALAEIT